VQQCGACELDVKLGPYATVLQLCSFAAWLPRHAALVKAISVNAVHVRAVDGMTAEQYWAVAEQLLLPALQLARSPPDEAVADVASAPAATPAAAAAASGQGVLASFPQQRGRLRLSSFSSDLRAAGMLGALPADSLTA
jgi:autotransporter translocation and assembly factor TamB